MHKTQLNADKELLQKIIDGEAPEEFTASPLGVAMGLKVLEAKKGWVKIEFSPSETFTQATGMIQGGAIASMLDFGMAFCCLTMAPDGHSVSTTNMNVNYLRPAPVGIYRVEGEIDRFGRTAAFASAKLYNHEGKLTATATSALLTIDLNH